MSLIPQSSQSPATETTAGRSEGFKHQNSPYFLSHPASHLQPFSMQHSSSPLPLFQAPNSQALSVLMCWHCFQEHSLEQFSRSKDLHLPNPSFGENSLILQFWEHRNSTTQVQNVLLVLWAGEGREGSGSENPQPAQGVTYCQRAVPHVRGYETLDCAILCIPGIEPLHVVLLYPPYDQHCYCRKNDQHYHRSQDNDD